MMWQVLGRLDLAPRTYAQAADIFDVVCLKSSLASEAAQLPATCVAICRLLKKCDCGPLSAAERLQCREAFTSFTDILSQLGLLPNTRGPQAPRPTSAEADAELAARERSLLEDLGWRIDMRSAEDWLTAYGLRLDIATAGMFRDSLVWALKHSTSCAKGARQQATVLELPPRLLATGYLCHGLVCARMLSYDRLCPEASVDATVWKRLYAGSQPGGVLPECSLRVETQDALLEQLCLATCSDMEAFKLATLSVLEGGALGHGAAPGAPIGA
uniref:Cyclin N-terminal domain-containing protein n=1 Tax=Zooxanthella nutricula TaxID=1333877 RepID=A0A7S2HGS7_9DINO